MNGGSPGRMPKRPRSASWRSWAVPCRSRTAGRLVREFRDRLLGLGEERAEVWGRPAALAVAKDGSLLVTADTGGTIWRISYKGPPPAEHAAVRAEEAGSAAQGQAALNWQGRIAFAAHLADER
jgi:hypothetical protein